MLITLQAVNTFVKRMANDEDDLTKAAGLHALKLTDSEWE